MIALNLSPMSQKYPFEEGTATKVPFYAIIHAVILTFRTTMTACRIKLLR